MCCAGMTCMLPDYMLLAVCGVRGLGRLGREHLAVALALEVPLAVVVTKADAAGRPQLDRALAQIRCARRQAGHPGRGPTEWPQPLRRNPNEPTP